MTEWIMAVSSVVSALGIILVAFQARIAIRQLSLSKEQLQKDHERSRREAAIKLLGEWSQFIREHGSGAKAVAEELSKEQTKKLYRAEEIEVGIQWIGLIQIILKRYGSELKEDQLNGTESTVILTRPQSHNLKRSVTSYLNMLETIMAARRHGVADEIIILEQFKDVCVFDGIKPILPDFRSAAGGSKTYPALEEFIHEVMNLSKPTPAREKL